MLPQEQGTYLLYLIMAGAMVVILITTIAVTKFNKILSASADHTV
jgi:hypothetical protein